MATFILTWNPDAWTDGDDWIADNAGVATASEPVAGAYSTGVRRQGIVAGDRAMLLRQRRDRGIVASGYFTTEIYDDEHWDGTGRVTHYADVEFDCITTVDDRLPVDVLKAEIPEVSWDRLQGSGVRVPDGVDDDLEDLWQSHVGDG